MSTSDPRVSPEQDKEVTTVTSAQWKASFVRNHQGSPDIELEDGLRQARDHAWLKIYTRR